MDNTGAFVLARKIYESEIWQSKPSWWLKVWIYILGHVNFRKRGKFNRGSGFFNRKMIYAGCALWEEEIKSATVDNVIRYLRENEMVTTQKTTRGMIISVCNYNKYQNLGAYENDTGDDLETRQKRDRNDTIQKNVRMKERKNKNICQQASKEKKEADQLTEKAKKVLEIFNSLQDRTGNEQFTSVKGFKKNLAYWLEDYSLEDIRRAVEGSLDHDFWKDKLTPTKLFRTRNTRGDEVDRIGDLMAELQQVTYKTPDGKKFQDQDKWKNYMRSKGWGVSEE